MKQPTVKKGNVVRAQPMGKGYPDGSIYVFPFAVFDDSPGGGNLGRIEWHVEPHELRQRGQSRIGGFLVWATQTRDKLYHGKTFWIPCGTDSVMRTARDGNGYFENVWSVGFCRDHRTLAFSAYPKDHHKELRVNVSSGIGVELEFR